MPLPSWRELKKEARATLNSYIEAHRDFPFAPVAAGDDTIVRQQEPGRRLLLGFLEGEGYLEVYQLNRGGANTYKLTSKGYAFARKSALEEFIEKYEHQIWYDVFKGFISSVVPTLVIGITFSVIVEFVKIIMHKFFSY